MTRHVKTKEGLGNSTENLGKGADTW